MADPASPGFFQGAALPDVKTTTATQTTAPAWYNNFLSGLAGTGQTAVEQGGVAGFSGLQNQVFGAAPQAVQAGQGALGTAVGTATDVANTPTMSMINQYMNPYTQQVVDEVGRLGQQNFENRLAPGATAAAVGSGQFGSTRGMNVYGNIARESSRDTTGQQGTLLQSGFNDALKASQAQQTLDLQAAQQLGLLSGQQYTQGTGGLDVLSKLGAQQQALEQAKLNYPMSALGQVSNLLKGYTVPTGVTQNYTGPMPNAYAKSPAELMAGLATGAGGFFAPGPTGQPSTYQNIKSATGDIAGLSKIFSNMGIAETGDPYGSGVKGSTQSEYPGGYKDPVSLIDYPAGTEFDAAGNYIGNKTGASQDWDIPVTRGGDIPPAPPDDSDFPNYDEDYSNTFS
jgi:hypothetical protein